MSAKSQRIEIRVSPAEKELWNKAAGGSRRVSEWLRALATAAASLEVEKPLINDPVIEAEKVSLKGVSISKPPPSVVPPAQQTCPRAHFHRPGVYCGTCGKVN